MEEEYNRIIDPSWKFSRNVVAITNCKNTDQQYNSKQEILNYISVWKNTKKLHTSPTRKDGQFY